MHKFSWDINVCGQGGVSSVYKPISKDCSTVVLFWKGYGFDRHLSNKCAQWRLTKLPASLQLLPVWVTYYLAQLFFFKHLWEGHVCHRGHKTTFRSPFSSTMWVLRIKFRTQAWEQAPLSIEQSLKPSTQIFSHRQVLEGSFPFLLRKLSGK